ncbi:hypothetical protein CL633_01455 [bacterium]|nr:hypothetical protein [bacterium]
MIRVKVKKTWHDMVAIRAKYYDAARKNKRDICIRVNQDQMILKCEELESKRVPMKNPVKVFDKFSGEEHILIYFKWQPSTVQQQLI